MMSALRGRDLNDADRQREGVEMQVSTYGSHPYMVSCIRFNSHLFSLVQVVAVEDIEGSILPTEYNPAKLDAFFKKRPSAGECIIIFMH